MQYVKLITINYLKITSFQVHTSVILSILTAANHIFIHGMSPGYSKQSVKPPHPELNLRLMKETYNITCICITPICSTTSSTCKDNC